MLQKWLKLRSALHSPIAYVSWGLAHRFFPYKLFVVVGALSAFGGSRVTSHRFGADP